MCLCVGSFFLCWWLGFYSFKLLCFKLLRTELKKLKWLVSPLLQWLNALPSKQWVWLSGCLLQDFQKTQIRDL